MVGISNCENNNIIILLLCREFPFERRYIYLYMYIYMQNQVSNYYLVLLFKITHDILLL